MKPFHEWKADEIRRTGLHYPKDYYWKEYGRYCRRYVLPKMKPPKPISDAAIKRWDSSRCDHGVRWRDSMNRCALCRIEKLERAMKGKR